MYQMRKLTNESGFTLLESLFHLLITIAFLHLIVLFLLFKDVTHNQLTDSLTTEWELFMVDIQADLSAVQSIKVTQNGTMLTANMMNEAKLAEYTNVGGVLRRRLASQGHVPLLTHVQSVEFIEEGPLLNVLVTLQDGTKRQRRVAIGLVP